MHVVNIYFGDMIQLALAEFLILNSWAYIKNLSKQFNINLTCLVINIKLIKRRSLDLLDREPELLHVNFGYISINEKGIVSRAVRPFGIKGILSPRFIGPFEILDHIGEVSYRLALPPQLSHVHNVFHVSLLRGYKYHSLHVVSYPLDQIREDLSFVEEPEKILDCQD
ncbi:hypothetical protein Tco_1274149 [Tanacetum coccineum]